MRQAPRGVRVRRDHRAHRQPTYGMEVRTVLGSEMNRATVIRDQRGRTIGRCEDCTDDKNQHGPWTRNPASVLMGGRRLCWEHYNARLK